jgi:tetratricopeptide (TPR) repeat protein
MERRNGLSEADSRDLDSHTAGCPDCRVSRHLHRSFADAYLSDDDRALVMRAAFLVANRPEVVRARHRRPWYVWAAAAVVLLGAGMAGAGHLLSRQRPTAPIPVPAPPEVPVEPSTPSANEVVPSLAPIPPSPRARPATRPARSAQALFARANEERRQGRADRAIALYRELQNEFSASPEANLSRVSLGRLHLDGKRWQSALDQFDRYLNREGSGVLAAEALYGRALALDGLGRTSLARQSWAELQRRFPDSAYAGAAARHLNR